MPLVAYLDESGDHSLRRIDPSSPTFCLTLALFDTTAYATKVVPAAMQLKMEHFGHDAVVLHSYDIRKAQGEFTFLRDPARRSAFLGDINTLMATPDYELIAVVIRKDRLVARYTTAYSPYDLSMKFALERLIDWVNVRGGGPITIVAESRGKREDRELQASFAQVLLNGTDFIPASDFASARMSLTFATKERNLIGHQMADLAAYAFARQYADPGRPYAPFGIVHGRLFVGSRGTIYGLKAFP